MLLYYIFVSAATTVATTAASEGPVHCLLTLSARFYISVLGKNKEFCASACLGSNIRFVNNITLCPWLIALLQKLRAAHVTEERSAVMLASSKLTCYLESDNESYLERERSSSNSPSLFLQNPL